MRWMPTFSLPISAYLLEQWTYLVRYLEDGRLELSNNRAERSIKPFVNTWPQFFFAAFPEEAEKYYADVLKTEEEWENYQDELANKLVKYVRALKKREAQKQLLEVLESRPEWQWERFIREHIE